MAEKEGGKIDIQKDEEYDDEEQEQSNEISVPFHSQIYKSESDNQSSNSYSPQLSQRNSSEESSIHEDEPVQEEIIQPQVNVVSVGIASGEKRQQVKVLQEKVEINIEEENEDIVQSIDSLWSSEEEREEYEEQIIQVKEQRHQQSSCYYEAYSWANIKNNQGLYMSLQKELNELKEKVNCLEKQRVDILCGLCSSVLQRSNGRRKTVEGVEVNSFFCEKCDSKYQIIPK